MISSTTTTMFRSALVIGASVGGSSASFSTSAAQNNIFQSMAEYMGKIASASNQHVHQNNQKKITHVTIPASKINGRENPENANSQWVYRNINGRATEEFARSLVLRTGLVEGQKNQPNMAGGLLGGENPTEECANQLARFKKDGIAGMKGIYFIRESHFRPSTNMEDQKMNLASTVGCAAFNAENSILLRLPIDTNSAPVVTELRNHSNVVMFVEGDLIQLDEEDLKKVQILCAKTARVFNLPELQEALAKGPIN